MKIVNKDMNFFREMKISQKNNKIADIRMLRTSRGLQIYIQSKVIHDLFNTYAGSSSEGLMEHWSNVHTKTEGVSNGYNTQAFCNDEIFSDLEMSKLPSKTRRFVESVRNGLRMWGYNTFVDDISIDNNWERINLSFLTSVHLNEGIMIWLWENFCVDNVEECIISYKKLSKKLSPKAQGRTLIDIPTSVSGRLSSEDTQELLKESSETNVKEVI